MFKQENLNPQLTKKIKIPLYGHTLYVTLIQNDEEWEDLLKGTDFPIPEGLTTINDRGQFLIALSIHKSEFILNGTLAHEANHAVNGILEMIGHTPQTRIGDDEPHNYLLTFIVARITRFIHERGYKVA